MTHRTGHVYFRNMMSLQNGSFHRLRRPGAGKYSVYMNGDFMGTVEELPKDCAESLPAQTANIHLPACCRI